MSTTTPEIQAKPNPAAAKPETKQARRRIPMSTPVRKLEVPEIPGYYLYWFREERVPRAMEAGYEMVKRGETALTSLDIAGTKQVDGNTDLGDNVSFVSGTNDNGVPQRAYLMKLKQEFRDEDQAELDRRNAAILQAIFRGEQVGKVGEGASAAEPGSTYVKQALFNRPARKAKLVGPR